MYKNIKPLQDKIFAKRSDKKEETTASGLIVTSESNDAMNSAVVLAVGPGKLDNNGNIIPMSVKKDDLVFFGKFSGVDAGNDVIVLREDDIFGVIKN